MTFWANPSLEGFVYKDELRLSLVKDSPKVYFATVLIILSGLICSQLGLEVFPGYYLC